MNAEAIIQKYWRAVDDLTNYQQDVLSDDAIRLALSLAVQDAFAAGAALADDLAAIVASQAQATPDQRQAESAISQIGRLAEWLEEHRPALYHDPDLNTAGAMIRAYSDLLQQLAQMDEDEAGLRRQVVELQREVDRLTRQNVIATDTFNSLAERTNGAAAVVTEPRVDWWQHLDPETNDYRISLDAGRRKFREVPKPARLLLAQAVARHIGGGVLPKQADFDAHKPDWMPGGGGLAVTFGCNWSELLTVSPAEVAP